MEYVVKNVGGHKLNQPINTAPPWWDGTIAIAFSTNDWEYILNGLYSLVENAPLLGWAGTEVETDIRNIIDYIEKNIGLE
jgi:hypothetical protein